MKLTTSRIPDGDWRVMKDGEPTSIILEKDEAPKFGQRQEWVICVEVNPGSPDEYRQEVASGILGKARALLAVERIVEALS